MKKRFTVIFLFVLYPDAPSLKGDRVSSPYDLWRKSIRPRNVFSDIAVSALKKPSRLELATKSSAFLASDYRIKLRHPALPTAKDIAAKGALLKSRKTERAFKANVTRVLEQRRLVRHGIRSDEMMTTLNDNYTAEKEFCHISKNIEKCRKISKVNDWKFWSTQERRKGRTMAYRD